VTTQEPVTPETRFSVGSLTKSMVAKVIARLAKAGRLSWKIRWPRTCRSWVQRLGRRREPARSSCESFRASLRAGLEFDFAGRKDEDDGALSRLAADIPADVPAADFWSYTNVGWCLLGRVIENATDAAWDDAKRRHLESAGMCETAFASDAVQKRRASGHEAMADGPVPVEPLVARAYGPAGTNVVSTVTDLLRFADLHLENPALAALREVQAEIAIYGWLDSWCLGWARFDWDGGQVWGWTASSPASGRSCGSCRSIRLPSS
jgi:CubicO group peptidase (beta-lactamase class C family)